MMGPNGTPTSIDFSKQYVIAVIGDKTNITTDFIPQKLTKEKVVTLIFTYKVSKGRKMSATIKPSTLIIVDKKYNGEIKLNPITM
ncbi:hypothetical protein [Elizabethkingia anophelis]